MKNKKRSRSSLIDIIASEGCIEILEPFLYKPGIKMYQSEVVKKSGIPKTRAIRLLKSLTYEGILEETILAGTNFYSATFDNPVIKQLKVLVAVSKVFNLTRKYSGRDIELYLFGSTAKGEDSENSDLDLLIISDANKNTIYDMVTHIKNNVNREVNPVIYKPMEYASLYNKDKAFYEQLERYKIRVL